MTKEEKAAYYRQYWLKNKEKCKAYSLKSQKTTKGKEGLARRNKRYLQGKGKYSKKYKEDATFRMYAMCRRIVHRFLRGSKSERTEKYLGAPVEIVKHHLESKFQLGMSWDNYGYGPGKWVVDHIKPMKLFDVTKEEDRMMCNHYTNLQPLWWEDNMAKSDKIIS